VYNSSPNTVTSLLGGAGGDHAFVMSATRFWHRITVECDLPSILPVALNPVASVRIFNALTTSALGVGKFANCVPVRSLNGFSQWRLWYVWIMSPSVAASSAVFHSIVVAVGAVHRVGCELTKVTKLVYHTITDQYRSL